MMKKLILIGSIIPILYSLSYLGFRASNIEIWEKNGKQYVIFPEKPLVVYYFYRPLSYIDAKATGVGAHIGDHQE